MKVKEMIEVLSKSNPDLPVFLSLMGACSISIDRIEVYINAVLIIPNSKLDIVRD